MINSAAAMTPLDWVIIAIFFISLVTGAINGFFVEVCSIGGLVAGTILAGMYYTGFAAWLMQFFHSVSGAKAVAFLLIVVGVLIAAGIVGKIIRWMLRKVGLGWADRLLGLVVGVVKCCILATILAMAVTAFFAERPWVRQSRLLPYFTGAAHEGAGMLPGELSERVRHSAHPFRKQTYTSAPENGTVTF